MLSTVLAQMMARPIEERMLTDALIEELRHKGEGSDLDYKAERYPFAKASDDEKSEMLKDILALANTYRDGTAYILMGFKERSPHPAEVVGVSPQGAVDDSRLQEFVNGKLETKLTFRYEERLFGGKHIAVISIPRQPRPFFLNRDYGKLSRNVVYVRRGSATGIASPREIAMMGAANVARAEARVSLSFQTPENRPLPQAFERQFLIFPDDLPDLVRDRSNMLYLPSMSVNEDYWRDEAYYRSSWRRVIQVRLLLTNQSGFSLGNMHLEVTCGCPTGESVSLLRADDMPGKPESSYLVGMRTALGSSSQAMHIDERGLEPVAHIALGAVRPGQTVLAEEDLAILPSGPGSYVLKARILADEVPTPLLVEHRFAVSGPVTNLGEDDLIALVSAGLDDDSR